MKTKRFALIPILISLVLCGCAVQKNQTVKIAVMGNPADFYPGYKEGIERAVEDLNGEYADSGCVVECEFYSDNGSYEEGASIIDALSEDKSVTAVIGTKDMDINKTAAHVFNEADKLFVVPYFLYDSVYENNHYATVFSMCNSAGTVGEILCSAASDTNAKRWAVCAAESEFERMEMNGFLKYSMAEGITVADCADMSMLVSQFDDIYKLWEILGVEGVVIFPGSNEGFDVLKNIKQRNPNIICAGDTAFDNSVMMENDSGLREVMTGFIMADGFAMRDETEEKRRLIVDMAEEYKHKTGNELDTWYIQAYNAVRMIADTAIQNKTFNCEDIARLLHENGYSGLCQDFKFNENGAQVTDIWKYNIFNENGYTDEHILGD